MAMKAKASSQGSDFKRFIGVGSFRVVGVNPTKEELDKFYGSNNSKEPVYFEEKKDEKNNDEAYTRVKVSFMIQADLNYEDGKLIKENAALKEPFKTVINFFLESRFFYNNDRTKVQVIDKYGRTAWVTLEQCRNRQIPIYSNGPAKIDPDYRPAFIGEDRLTEFFINYLNITPIESYNRNSGTWIPNPHPEDSEANLYKIKDYFRGDISELKENCELMPFNRLKLCVGVGTDKEGKQFTSVYNNLFLRNGSQSYTRLRDAIEGDDFFEGTVFTDDPAGVITNIHEYNEVVKETNFEKEDPFNNKNVSDLPFGPETSNDSDPFKGFA